MAVFTVNVDSENVIFIVIGRHSNGTDVMVMVAEAW